MRPLSQRDRTNSQRPAFQTKLRLRGSTRSEMKGLDASYDPTQTQRSRHDHKDCLSQQEDFNRTAGKLADSNFSHHQHGCVCSDCHCGRHLCRLNVIKPDLSKNTVYQMSFTRQQQIPNVVNRDKEYSRLQGPHLDINSTYLEGFTGKPGDKVERPVPEDLLKSGGPSPQLSTYSANFPGYRCENQYVKPTDKHTRGYFPQRSRSTYANEYVKKDALKDDYTYFPDQLRSNSNWFGRSTYENFCSSHNPEYFARKVKVLEKLQEKPDFAHQYGTFRITQKPSTRTTSCPRTTRSARPRCTSRPRRRAASWSGRASSPKTRTSRPFPLNSTRSPLPSTPMCDCLHIYTAYCNQKMSSQSACSKAHGEHSSSSISCPAALPFALARDTVGLRGLRRNILSSSCLSLAFGESTYLYSCFVSGWSTVLKSLSALSSLALASSSSVRLRKYLEPTLRIFSARPSSTLIMDLDFLRMGGSSWPMGSRLMVFFLQSGRLFFLACWWNLWSISSL